MVFPITTYKVPKPFFASALRIRAVLKRRAYTAHISPDMSKQWTRFCRGPFEHFVPFRNDVDLETTIVGTYKNIIGNPN